MILDVCLCMLMKEGKNCKGKKQKYEEKENNTYICEGKKKINK